MDPKKRGYIPYPHEDSPAPRKVRNSLEMAKALVHLIEARNKIHRALDVVPNAVTRQSLDESIKTSIVDIANDIASAEG